MTSRVTTSLRRVLLKRTVHDALVEARYAREAGHGGLATALADAAERHWLAGVRTLAARDERDAGYDDPGERAVRGVAGWDWPVRGEARP